MEHIFVNMDEEFPPGEVAIGEISAYGDGPPRMLAVRCIRTASMEEYIAWVNEHDLGHMVNRTIFDKKLYLVEVLD